jgi:hypothetical protein
MLIHGTCTIIGGVVWATAWEAPSRSEAIANTEADNRLESDLQFISGLIPLADNICARSKSRQLPTGKLSSNGRAFMF